MKTGKNFKIAATRPSLIGDSISFLPVLNYFDLLFPGSYKHWFVAKKCAQSAFLYFNHEKIDNIRILELPEALGPKDLEIFNSCDIRTNPFPQHKGMPGIDCFWWNERPMAVETWNMAGLPEEHYYKLPKELQKPKLNIWFDVEKYPKTLAIWNFAAYGKEPKRSPRKEWWEKMYKLIIEETDFKILRFGHPDEPDMDENNYVQDLRNLSFFDQVKASVGCSICINTNSGIGWVLGAYGLKQITLLTNDAPNHNKLLYSFQPENWAGQNISLLNSESCDNIPHEEVLDAVEKLK